MFGQYKCLKTIHNDMQIQAVCQNKFCKQPSRRICFQCIRDHLKNDQNFDYSDIKGEEEIQQMINEFKYYNVDRMNNIALQCQIQQYLLNIELIEYVKLWDYKYHKIHEILDQLNQFNKQWKKMSLHDYLDDDKKNIIIAEYFQYFQQKLLHIDELKDIYIKDIIKEQKYNKIDANTEQNRLSIDMVQIINAQNQLFSNITQNDLFKRNHVQNEEFIIKIWELMLKQGYDLRTDALYDKFRILQDVLLDNSIKKYKHLYIQSYNIAWKQQINESQLGLSLINQSLDIQGKYAKSFNIKGIFKYQEGKVEKSIKMFDQAIKIDPKYVQAYNNKGLTINIKKLIQQIGSSLDIQSKYVQAIKMYDEAIKIDPKFFYAYHNKGSSLDSLQKFEQAIEMYDQAIKIDPKFVYAYNGKGYSLHNLQKYQQAIEMYDEAIKIDPNFFYAYYNKGNSLYNLQKYELAIEMLDEAIKLDPIFFYAYSNKGYSLFKLQKYEQAIEIFDQAIKIEPKFVNAYYSKADSLFQLKLYNQSINILQQGLLLEPNHDGMKKLIKLCDEQLKT